jgi:hypothetical protein
MMNHVVSLSCGCVCACIIYSSFFYVIPYVVALVVVPFIVKFWCFYHISDCDPCSIPVPIRMMCDHFSTEETWWAHSLLHLHLYHLLSEHNCSIYGYLTPRYWADNHQGHQTWNFPLLVWFISLKKPTNPWVILD